MRRSAFALILGGALALAPGVRADSLSVVPSAQTAPQRSPEASAAPASLPAFPPIRATRLQAPMDIDGVLDEPAWQSVPPESAFTQRDPVEGAPPTQRTEVRVAYDDQALYIGARMWDDHPDSIVARLVRRDNLVKADRFMVYIDPFHDRRSGFYFGVNAAGVHYDGTLFNDSWDDDSWDAVWQGRAHIDARGWTVEMRIPFSQLRFRHQIRCLWAINFRREITRTSETDWLVYMPRKGSGFVSRFPDLVGVGDLRAGRSIELMPYMTGKAEYLDHLPQDPFNHGSRYHPSEGGDLRTSVGGALTLNATINPDFGQVEVDPAVVNLSDVESFFQEKRPFFVENSRVFGFGNEGASDYWGFNWPEPVFFYSRRIGRTPQGSLPGADFTDVPVATRILGAAKLTGKLGRSWNFGTVHALTSRERADLLLGSTRWQTDVEPLTYYEDTRAFREFQGGRNGLGVMGSAVVRHFDDAALRDQLNRSSFTTGLDGFHFLDASKVWVLSGYTAVSRVAGTRTRMQGLEQSAVHYFQRPDAREVHLDSTATSMTGWVARAWLNKQSGEHFISNSAIGAMSPKFDVNDIGFESRADVINGHAGVGWKWDNLTRWRKYGQVLGALFQARDFAGHVVSTGVWTEQQIEFINNYSWNQTLSANPQTLNIRRTRGGPITLNLPDVQWTEHFDTDSKSKQYYSVDTYFFDVPQGHSSDWSVSPSVVWQPVSNFSISVGPSFERYVENAQYVDTVNDSTALATYRQGYIFAHLDQRTVSANLRLNVAFTPNLSLQTYIQPLISAANYGPFKQLVRPRSYDFGPTSYPGANPSFNFRSLRGNAVLRWEYRPGSTLYLVWTQQRTGQVDTGDLEFSSSFDRLIRARANDIFLLKASYYFTL